MQGSDEDKAAGRLILVEVLEALRIVAVMLSPVTPTLSQAIYLQLGFSQESFQGLKLKDSQWGGKLSASNFRRSAPCYELFLQDLLLHHKNLIFDCSKLLASVSIVLLSQILLERHWNLMSCMP